MNGGSATAWKAWPSTSTVPDSTVDPDARAAPGGSDGVWAGEREQPQVDAVALEDPCEALRDHAADSGGAHRRGHVLARRPGAEVGARDEDRVADELVAERRVEAFEQVRRHLEIVEDADEPTGIHDVRVDVVLIDHDRRALEHHATTFPTTSAG